MVPVLAQPSLPSIVFGWLQASTSALYIAASNDNMPLVELLINLGADVNLPCKVSLVMCPTVHS